MDLGSRLRLFRRLSKRDLIAGRRALRVAGSVMELPSERAWAFPDGEYYEKGVTHWFLRILAGLDRPVVYDVGANYGYYALVAAPRARQVYAFEPASGTFEVLERNVERNRLRHVRPLRLALSDATEPVELHLYSSSGSNALAERELPPGSPVRYLGRETVRAVRLDDLVEEEDLAPPSLVKIDTEGSELGVLRGARGLLARHRPALLVEDSGAIAGSYSREALVEELERVLPGAVPYELYALVDESSPDDLRPLAELEGKPSDFVIALPPVSRAGPR